jgi:hypothetical protein
MSERSERIGGMSERSERIGGSVRGRRPSPSAGEAMA